ncbi:toxin-antitoxin system YwqK family antitoxin [Mucilaginibacter sp. PPCGB 2223]|uniref:toxin-antitoxin system YwqK family antitoxin n=1 Tax=Mucilaginibacter sp. PPCGB 2223 TaxID=1886027 RepID=UPI001585E218|nr:toxin-antitoxin system YwqK family antitoxin [Mucilaginibacter sp. PPCGB 2223]
MKIFSKTGEIKHENSQGNVDGQYCSFDNGKMLLKAEYVNGKIEGWLFTFYPNGQIKQRALYKNNVVQGIESEYFEDGKLKLQRTYKDGSEDGAFFKYYENGKLQDKGQKKNDKFEGIQYGYYESGKLKHISNYLYGKRYGDEIFYYENGKIEAYFAYDITGEKFYIERYSVKDSLQLRAGHVFSAQIYSITGKGDSTIILENKHAYSDIKDLYITTADSPPLDIAYDIVINGKVIIDPPLHHNTIKIANVFDKNGPYKIEIAGKFFNDANSDIIHSASVITIIKK